MYIERHKLLKNNQGVYFGESSVQVRVIKTSKLQFIILRKLTCIL